jgi:hypothetical protein
MNVHWKSVVAMGIVCLSSYGIGARASTPAHLTDLGWLAGVWHAHALGGEVEDVYQPLSNHEIVSSFRLMIHGQTRRYELRRIKAEHDEIVYQELGFDGDFKHAAPVPDRLLISADRSGRAQFHDLLFHRTGANTMDVTLTRPDQDGKAQTVIIHYTRIARFQSIEQRTGQPENGEE